MLKKTLLTTAAAAAIISFATHAQAAEKQEREKCYGIAKAGKNDCGSASGSHSCAGQSKMDGDGHEWIFVPKGLCDRLAGGSTAPFENKKK